MTDTPEPRLGAALIIGADAAMCVHVHTGPSGITAIWDKLNDLDEQTSGTEDRVPVVAVLGVENDREAPVHDFRVPAASVDELAAAALAVNQ